MSVQQNLVKGFHGNLSYSLSKSEFFDETQQHYRPSSMDARHILNLTFGNHFSNGWQIGVKGRLQSSLPFTPFNLEQSAAIATWHPASLGIKDYSRLNQQRLSNNFGLDIRIDKVFTLKNSTAKVYADLMDVLRSNVSGPAFLATPKDSNGFPIIDAMNPNQYEVARLDNKLASFLPTLGVELEF